MATSSAVAQLYKTVVEDVINNVKEAFLDDGVDEQVLTELKQLWNTKMQASKALDTQTTEHDVLLHKHLFIPHNQQVIAGATQVQQVGVPIQLATSAGQNMGAAATATMALPQGIFQQQLAALNNTGNIQLQHTGNGQFIQVLSHQLQQQHQPQQQQVTLATTLPQQTIIPGTGQIHQQQLQGIAGIQGMQLAPGQQVRAQNPNGQGMIQLDGARDTSSSEDDDYNDDDDENEDENNEADGQGEEEEPLNSEDDVSEQDPDDLFDTDNVVVCQYDKINRNKNKWKFHFKDGIMNLNGRDYVFQKATGDAEW